MKTSAFVSIIPALILAASAPASEQIYRWRDKDGNLVVSTTPPPPDVKLETRQVGEARPGRSTKQEASARAGAQDVEYKRPYRDIKVILYMTDWCPVCRSARVYLKSLGVSLVEYNIETSPERKKWLLLTGSRKTVPVIDIEGVILHELDQAKIKAAVEEKRFSNRY